MFIPKISEFTIRRHANAKSFQRGEAYYKAGAVQTVTQRNNQFQAEVAGNEAKPYRVNLIFDDQGLTSANCTCAYNLDGWCKHIVATILFCLRQPQVIEQRPTLEQLLDSLDQLQTQRLVQELVARYPQLIEAIDHHVSWMVNSAPKQQTAKSVRLNTVNSKPFGQQVRQIFRDAVRLWEDGYEDDPVNEELPSVIQTAVEFCERGDGYSAIAILETITCACVENWQDVAEYGADNDQIVEELNHAWSEAILTVELSPEEKVDIQVNLETWQDEWNADFGMSLEALHQGWDEPALLSVLEGNMTSSGVWEEEVPDYADDLALIRLKILERQERYQEYLYLAASEGQTEEYLTMLGRLGRVEEAIAAAQTEMNSMEAAFTLAKVLAAQGSLQQALDIAQTGFNLPGNSHYELGIWTSDLALELGNHQASLLAMKTAFQVNPSFFDYQRMAELAGENWESVKIDLLEIIRAFGGWETASAKVDIFLHEGLIDDAMAIVSELSFDDSELIHRVMNAAIPYQSDWVIANARRRAEKIMNEGKSEYYYYAVEWLKKARAAYLQSGRTADWSSYRAELVQIHARKRKLMEMFKQRGME